MNIVFDEINKITNRENKIKKEIFYIKEEDQKK